MPGTSVIHEARPITGITIRVLDGADRGRVFQDLNPPITNGTKVNNEDVQLRILRFGDMIQLGRSVLLFGSREQIAQRLSKLRAEEGDEAGDPQEGGKAAQISSLDFELNWSEDADLQATIH